MDSITKSQIRKDNLQKDLIDKGFHKLDDNLVSERPPRISWGKIYQGFTDKEKVMYLEKLASTMNHAAHLIQQERNQLQELCEKKEKQITSLKSAMEQNMVTLQNEMTKINEERQQFNQQIAKLNRLKRELNNGDNN